MTVPLALAVLVVFEAMLAGFRAAAGRDGRVDKRAYNRAAIRRGAVAGVVVVAANVALVAALVGSAADRDGAWGMFVDAGASCVWVFGGFATLTIAAIAFWVSPIPEVRMLATVLVLGPLSLIRPLVVAGGLVVAAARANDPRVWVAAIAAGVSTLALERVLERRYTTR